MTRECLHLHFILACDFILLSTNLGRAALYSKSTKYSYTGVPILRCETSGLPSGDAQGESGTAH